MHACVRAYVSCKAGRWLGKAGGTGGWHWQLALSALSLVGLAARGKMQGGREVGRQAARLPAVHPEAGREDRAGWPAGRQTGGHGGTPHAGQGVQQAVSPGPAEVGHLPKRPVMGLQAQQSRCGLLSMSHGAAMKSRVQRVRVSSSAGASPCLPRGGASSSVGVRGGTREAATNMVIGISEGIPHPTPAVHYTC